MVKDAAPTEHRPLVWGGGCRGAAGREAESMPNSHAAGDGQIVLRPNPRNPRERFDERELDELAASIKERGASSQPIVVHAVPTIADAYEIIAGDSGAARRARRTVIVVAPRDIEMSRGSAPISPTTSRKPRATPSSAPTTGIRMATLAGSSARAGATSQRSALGQSAEAYTHCSPEGSFSRACARAPRRRRPDTLADRIVAEGVTVRH